MKNSLYLILVITIMSIFFTSCEKDKIGLNSPIELSQLEQKDVTLTDLAKVLAKAQASNEFRQILLAAAKEKYGGENSVFYFDVKDAAMANHGTVEQYLASVATELGVNPAVTNFKALSQHDLAKISFTIFDGTSANDLSVFSYETSIVVVPETEDFQVVESKNVAAFRPSLETVSISNTEEPQFAVMVVEQNAAFLLLDKKSQTTLNGVGFKEALGVDQSTDLPTDLLDKVDHHKSIQINNQEYILININQSINYLNSLTVGENRGSDNSRACNRDGRTGREHIAGIKINENELKQFCKWYKSTCKVEVNTTFSNNPNSTTMDAFAANLPKKYIIGDRSDMKNNKTYDISPDLSLYKWEYLEGVHGDRFSIDLIGKHHNPDGSTTFTIGFAPKVKFKLFGAEVEFTILNTSLSFVKAHNDITLGGDLIYYCDGIDIIPCQQLYLCGKYTTGSTDFWITKYSN